VQFLRDAQVQQVASKQPDSLLLMVNPQWQSGQVVSDFGFFGRKGAEQFIASASAQPCTGTKVLVESSLTSLSPHWHAPSALTVPCLQDSRTHIF